jgi:hypothetical protein
MMHSYRVETLQHLVHRYLCAMTHALALCHRPRWGWTKSSLALIVQNIELALLIVEEGARFAQRALQLLE